MSILKAESHCPELDRRWTHKNETSHDLFGICWHAKDLYSDHELEARTSEIEPVVIRGLKVMSLRSHHYDHISFIVCPSAVYFGTV